VQFKNTTKRTKSQTIRKRQNKKYVLHIGGDVLSVRVGDYAGGIGPNVSEQGKTVNAIFSLKGTKNQTIDSSNKRKL
jgi:hypothetical protein